MSTAGFLHELRRRHVYCVAVAYAAAAWVLLQLAAIVFPTFNAPVWVMRAVTTLLAFGFPIALMLAWAFDVTPRGVEHTKDAEGVASVRAPARSRRSMVAVGAAGAVFAALALTAYWRYPPRASSTATQRPPAVASSTAASIASKRTATAAPDKSIAVLPFENLSPERNNAYFSDGITEEILNALAQIPDLKVAGRRSAFRFRGSDLDLRKVGQMLGVVHVLEGSLQKAGDEVRIYVRLVDTRNGFQLWSEKYDRKVTSIFAIEDEISLAIANKLRVQFGDGAGHALTTAGTRDPQAHDLYLRGLSFLAARAMREAAVAFRQAVNLDAGYTQAWGALAEAEALLPAYALDAPGEALRRAQTAAQRAIALNPQTSSAHVALGIVHAHRWLWPQAEDAFRRAAAASPNDAEAINQYAQFLFTIGQPERALGEIERAQKIDPLAAVIGVNRAEILMAMHRGEEALAQIDASLALHPDFALAHSVAMMIHLDRRDYAAAERHARLAAQFNGNDPEAAALFVRGVASPAPRPAAVRAVETVSGFAPVRRDPILHALHLTRLHEFNGALLALEDYASRRDSTNAQLLRDPSFDPLRDAPRFRSLLQKMRLPDAPVFD